MYHVDVQSKHRVWYAAAVLAIWLSLPCAVAHAGSTQSSAVVLETLELAYKQQQLQLQGHTLRFSIRIRERAGSDGVMAETGRYSHILRRQGDQWWQQVESAQNVQAGSRKASGELVLEAYADGRRTVLFNPPVAGVRQTGSSAHIWTDDNYYSTVSYHFFAGAIDGVAWAGWLREHEGEIAGIEVTEKGLLSLRVACHNGLTAVIEISPQCGYGVVRRVFTDAQGRTLSVFEAEHQELVPGLWIVHHADHKVFNPEEQGLSLIREFVLDPVDKTHVDWGKDYQAKAFAVELPQGTRIFDHISGYKYVAGEVSIDLMSSMERAIKGMGNEEGHKTISCAGPPMRSADVSAKQRASVSWRWAVGGAAGVLALCAFGMWHLGRRRRWGRHAG